MERQKQKLIDNGYDLDECNIVLIDDDAYCDSLVGITDDDRAVYDELEMAREYAEKYKCSFDEALEYIEYNIIRALPYYDDEAPIVFYRLQ